jgi:copper chaperone
MTDFNVPGLNCGHCTATMEKAIRSADPAAKIACDVPARRVSVDSALPDDALSGAIRSAGYEVRAAP